MLGKDISGAQTMKARLEADSTFLTEKPWSGGDPEPAIPHAAGHSPAMNPI